MSKLRTAAAAATMLALTACIPQPSEPTPAPSAPPPPVQAEPPAPPVAVPVVSTVPDNWADQPRTQGDWNYTSAAGGSSAVFTAAGGERLLGITCTRATRSILLVRMARNLPQVAEMDLRTETASRAANLAPLPDGSGVGWSFPATDSLLDAIAFSRGHFAVGVTNTAPIYPPAYPEITRVIEDCR